MIHVNLTRLRRLLLVICYLLLATFPPNVVSLPTPPLVNYTNNGVPAFIYSLRRSTRMHCSCGDALLQSRFCKQDFAVIADVNAWKAKPFYGMQPTPNSSTGWPYSGMNVPMRVLRSLKGNLEVDQNINVYYIQGGICGISKRMLPLGRGKYIISGFRVTVPGCRELGNLCHLPSEILVVTRCGWSEPLEDVTTTQMAGLFLGMYSCGPSACIMQPSFLKTSLPQPSNICSYDYTATRCYSRFSICIPARTPFSNSTTCQLRAVKRISTSPQLFQLIPKELHPILSRARRNWSNDENLFSICMSHTIFH